MLIGAISAFTFPKNNKPQKRQASADENPVATTTGATKAADQTAVVAKSGMSDERMAVDYNGYYYGTSGNVEQYQSWLVTRPLQYGSNAQ
jgi:hypothetical protein